MSQVLLSALIEGHLLRYGRVAALGHRLTLDVSLHAALLQTEICFFLAKYRFGLHLLFEELTLLLPECFCEGERIRLKALGKVHA